MKENIRFKVNGRPVSLNVDPERMLLWILRTDLGLTGTKYGCGEGFCGACTVLVDGEPVRSCDTPAGSVRGQRIVTIEGLAVEGRLHPLQEAFVRHNVAQCGFCTPGMILAAAGFLSKNPRPTRADILRAMEGNLCRCSGYWRIVEAIESAALGMSKGEWR